MRLSAAVQEMEGWGKRGQELAIELQRMREQTQVAEQVMALKINNGTEGDGKNVDPHMVEALSEKVGKPQSPNARSYRP